MVPISWFFGPDREPFVLDDGGAVWAAAGMPFHGIVSRGTRELLQQAGVAPEVWLRNAHRLEAPEQPGEGAELSRVRAAARLAGALSFGESAACVWRYLEQHCVAAGKAAEVEAWNIKEGHTSSVWGVSLRDAQGSLLKFIVNVARDRSASAELDASSKRLRQIRAGAPTVLLAEVEDIERVRVPLASGPAEVVVTRNEWLSGCQEIHAVQEQRRSRYLLVERFLTMPDAPAHIVSIYGRRCSDAECRQIDSDIASFREQAAAVLQVPTELEVNDGDLVWNGSRAVVVATS
jgi:hypothetical protein